MIILVKEFACRKCRLLTTGKICPNCESTDLTLDWSGLTVILDSENSEVAKTLSITKPGKYAVKVS